MRRKDREMPREFAIDVVDKCEYAVLSVVGVDGAPYCVPVSIVREEDSIYFHCARCGYKTECLCADPRVCIACVGETRRSLTKFTTAYESAVIRGTASQVDDGDEKIRALRLLCQRHTPTNMMAFDKAIEKSIDITAVWKIKIQEITGKRKVTAPDE